ncbi:MULTISPECIES: hypothetical protein [Mesonia]|uniref:Uncharacterized protein n=1 Tax=Mesonia oceanica TaxID=2687242 RepID=A0AC61YDE4_9FLAO|nr:MULTISPECIES: hypothetical protein [Mesonia]MAN27679.1 hypothetical protein [Mesonia sp.]MBJ98847.1 hypothetical protein [Flavobacteriaceae bacterium]VVV02539.1 hypothetical protein FVB9532_03839 [Mesonia oceanica]|tara:strand:+ start:2694 stop:2954 length:261 start_codon:yes stop_codon:yes gene_type:complete
MKKNILLSITLLLLIVMVSFGFSSNATNEDFVPLEKGKKYLIFLSNGQQIKFTVLEEPKGNWVKVDMKGGGNFYLSLENAALISTE